MAVSDREPHLLHHHHHRHWHSALDRLSSGCRFSMLPLPVFPTAGVIMGGTITLSGGKMLLAFFQGINFRSKYWVLFNISYPYIDFSTEAQRVDDGGECFLYGDWISCVMLMCVLDNTLSPMDF